MGTPETIQVFEDFLSDLPIVLNIFKASVCNSSFMLPTSTILAVAWLSVYHLTCDERKIGRQDRSENSIALNSRHVELLLLSSCDHILWQTCSPSLIYITAPQATLLASEKVNYFPRFVENKAVFRIA